MKELKTKFAPGEKVKTITGSYGYVNCIQVYKDSHSYHIWDGGNGWQNMDEWMLQKADNRKTGFTIKF